MFNPKQNLLDEQLAVSGLEMHILGAVFAGVSAVTSIVGGIKGSQDAKKANSKREANAEAQRKAAQEQADKTNEYNKKVFAAEKQNYFDNRQFQYETALKNWRYNQQIRDYEYNAIVQRYAKSVENTDNQLTFNSVAAMDAYASEQAALNEIMAEDAFNQQGALVDRLQQEGQASMGQAGVSRQKAIQSRIAAAGRNSAIADASLKSSVEQSRRNMRQIALQKYGADMQAKASMMIRPEALPDIPMPERGPARVFVAPMKAEPGFIPDPIKQSTTAPLLSGISSAAGSLASVDWANTFGGSGGDSGGSSDNPYGSDSEAPKSNIPRNIYGDD
jgi:hypothetical protein